MTQKPKPFDSKKFSVFEILKDDISFGGELMINWYDVDKRVRKKLEQYIKSAVQELIENLKEKQINARVYQSDELLDFYSGYEEGISDAIQEIKKWFPDAVKE